VFNIFIFIFNIFLQTKGEDIHFKVSERIKLLSSTPADNTAMWWQLAVSIVCKC